MRQISAKEEEQPPENEGHDQNPASGNQRDQFWRKKCDRLSHFGPGLTLDWWKATLRRAEQRIPRIALLCPPHLWTTSAPLHTRDAKMRKLCKYIRGIFFGASANLKRFIAIFGR